MKRKLFALLASVLAIGLLMGAGNVTVPAAVLTGSSQTAETLSPIEPIDQIENTAKPYSPENDPELLEMYEMELLHKQLIWAQAEKEYAQAEVNETQDMEAHADSVEFCALCEHTIWVNNYPVSSAVNKTVIKGEIYVSLRAMALELEPELTSSYRSSKKTLTITTDQMTVKAIVGKAYLEANGRCLYIPNGVKMMNGTVMVPLDTVLKVFDAAKQYDKKTGVTYISTGSGALEAGSSYYNSKDLFWLSRVIYAESGNHSLKGKIAVGNVILNRVAGKHWPNTIFGVISQKNQFSTYRGGALANRTPNEQSVIAAKLVLDGARIPEVKKAYFFDSTGGKSWAARNKNFLVKFDNHCFYDY